MGAVYRPFAGNYVGKDCTVCLQPVDEDAASHGNGGDLHPIHRQCAIDVITNCNQCPSCRTLINRDFTHLETLKKRCIRELKNIGKDMLFGMTVELIMIVAMALSALALTVFPILGSYPLLAIATGSLCGGFSLGAIIYIVETKNISKTVYLGTNLGLFLTLGALLSGSIGLAVIAMPATSAVFGLLERKWRCLA